MRATCKYCGRKVTIPRNYKSYECDYCWRTVYRNKKYEFIERMKSLLGVK